MVTCSLCGNEEIEKPKEIIVFIPKLELANAGVIRTQKIIRVSFGSYCFSKHKNACKIKAEEVKTLEMCNVEEKYKNCLEEKYRNLR